MINKIISFSIKNKVLIWLFIIALVAGGIYSITKVPLDAVPDITNNQVLVITTAPNLGTEDIEKFITYQVELAVSNLPDVTEIRSISRFGLSVVTIVFKDEAGTYLPRQLVSEALIEVKDKIPEGFGEPFMAPISTGLGEIYQYTLEVDPEYDTVYDDMELRTIQDWIVKRQMAMLQGVVEVNSFGGRKKQYEVAVNPDKLRSMGLSINDVFNALYKNNQNTGGAYIEKNHQANFIRGEGLMRTPDDIKNTLVKNINGQPVFIRDVANIQFGSFARYGGFIKNGKGEAVGGIVMMLKGANSNEVIHDVKERVKLIEKSLPPGISIVPFLDRSKLIKSTTTTIVENLSLGALIVIFILVIFLGNLRGGLIVASTIPLAMLFAFIMMNLFGVWANLMSLGALDFGILIDGAVIIVESMIFYLHRKNFIGTRISQQQKDKIAYQSASKMMNSAFFGQLIILIVFIPILALQGIEGKMFIPMAMTFGFAILGVMVLSLTYIPMVSATFLQAPKTNKLSAGDKAIRWVEKVYTPIINYALKQGKTIVLAALVLLIASGYLFSKMGAEFIPKLDEGDFAFQSFFKPGTSLTEVETYTNKIQQIVLKNFPDEIESIQSRIGVATLPMDPMPLDIADNFVIVKPKNNWTKAKSKKELMELVEEKVKEIPGINYEFTQPIEMRFNELLTGVREDIAIKLYGDDLNILSDKAQEIAGLVSGINGVGGVKTEATKGLPQITIRYNRNKMARYNLTISDMNKIIETAFSGGVAGKIFEGEKMFDLVVRLDEAHRKNINDIRNLFVSAPNGLHVPLKEIAEISYQPGAMQVSRDNTNRRTYVGINVKDRDIKSLVNEIKETLDQKLKLPAGYYIRYGGAFENLERATDRLTLVVPIALVLIFMLVYFAIKSFKQTLMIYVAIPFAAIGGVFSLYLRDMPFSISAGVGFIVLFGVAVLNGLVLINGFNGLKAEGKFSLNDIIKKGSVRRIRPILLTASTDILGFLPMAISTSAGAEVQRPLATVVIGGMLTSTLLTLIVLPVLYNWVETGRKQKSFKFSAPVVTIILLLFLTGYTRTTYAQTKEITFQQAIHIAKHNYPLLKAAQLEIEKQKALKSTAFDFGTTSIYTGKEEIGNGSQGIHNIIGFSQNEMDIFGMVAKSKKGESLIHQATVAKELTEQNLIYEVNMIWNNALITLQQMELYRQTDSLYAAFLKAAKVRYKTGQSSKLEWLSASSKYKEVKINISRAENEHQAALLLLNQYLRLDEPFKIRPKQDEKLLFTPLLSIDSLKNNPILNLYQAAIQLSEKSRKAEKSVFFPKFNFSYGIQAIDGVSGFNTWQAGITLPLIFNAQAGKSKAARLNYKIAQQQYAQQSLEINTRYKQLLNQYLVLSDIITYYNQEALPLTEEQISAAAKAYKLGDIDYVQLIQNLETAINIKLEYLQQKAKLLQVSAELNFLTGNKF